MRIELWLILLQDGLKKKHCNTEDCCFVYAYGNPFYILRGLMSVYEYFMIWVLVTPLWCLRGLAVLHDFGVGNISMAFKGNGCTS